MAIRSLRPLQGGRAMLRIAEDADCHVGLCPPRNDVLIGSWTFCFGAAVWVGCTAERSMPVPYIGSPRMILQKCAIVSVGAGH